MKIYKITEYCCKPLYYKNKIQARKIFVDIAVRYWKEHQLDDRDLEKLPCGGEQYVADRFLCKDDAKVISKMEIINVL
jgi:hypothetical protein